MNLSIVTILVHDSDLADSVSYFTLQALDLLTDEVIRTIEVTLYTEPKLVPSFADDL